MKEAEILTLTPVGLEIYKAGKMFAVRIYVEGTHKDLLPPGHSIPRWEIARQVSATTGKPETILMWVGNIQND